MRRRATRTQGQVTVEVAILFGFVVAALVAMAIYLQRAVQGGMKSNSDSFGTQFKTGQAWTSNTSSNTFETANTITSNQTSKYYQNLP